MYSKTSAFSCNCRIITIDHNYTFFGAQYRACNLVPSTFRLPSPGLPVDFTTDLLAILWSGGNSAVRTAQCQSKLYKETYYYRPFSQALRQPCKWADDFSRAVTHWVTLSNFKDHTSSHPNDSDLAWHEERFVM